MSRSMTSAGQAPELTQFEHVVAACDRFEALARSAVPPRIELFLAEASESIRAVLFRELLALELELRCRRGERIAIEEYVARFPDHAAAVVALFAEQVIGARGVPDGCAPSEEMRNDAGCGVGRGLPQIPGYEILAELGRGGMGVVFHARRVRLNRSCALKMILAGRHAGPEATLRFLAEAETIAQLTHDGIVQIYSLGNHDGCPYIELEYLEGGSLAQTLSGIPRPAREAAALVRAMANAVGEAHRQGIVHRDLKPANVLLTADGRPKVADFGLAKTLGAESGLTRTDSVLGSPSYMAPEQADGHSRDAKVAADIYALGAIFYELLTGRPPIKGATVLETLDLVKTVEPVSPTQLVPGLKRDAETICLTCLQKEPWRRYPTARALADDLQRFLDRKPILARPTGPAERAWRWVRRNPAQATSGAMLALLAVSVIGAAFYWWNQSAVKAATAREKVEMLTKAETVKVPEIVDQLTTLRRWADPLLAHAALEWPVGSKAALHVNLAILPVDPGREGFLLGWLTEAKTRPEELLVVREALARHGHAQIVAPRLWADVEGVSKLNDGQLRAAGALAGFDSKNQRWKNLVKPVAAKLVLENPMLLGRWCDVFRPVGGPLSRCVARVLL